MKKYALFFIILLLSISVSAQYKPWTSAKQPLQEIQALKKQIVKPNFRKKDYLVTDFGAVGDGKTKNTEAFRKAIEKCNAEGGGRVVVPEGVFLQEQFI
ncbi:glycosyl hydrolase family 28-related protein [Chryseobacterium wanjuense]